jgi:hypothetical protein
MKWIKGEKGILINLDNFADIVHKKQDNSIMGYTTAGFGIVLYKGSSGDCERVLREIEDILDTCLTIK